MASKDALSEKERRCLGRIRGILLSQGVNVTDDDLVTVVLKAALSLDAQVLDGLIRSGLKEETERKGRNARK